MSDFYTSAENIVKDFQRSVVKLLSHGVATAILASTNSYLKENTALIKASQSRLLDTLYVLDTQLDGNYGKKVRETIEYKVKGFF